MFVWQSLAIVPDVWLVLVLEILSLVQTRDALDAKLCYGCNSVFLKSKNLASCQFNTLFEKLLLNTCRKDWKCYCFSILIIFALVVFIWHQPIAFWGAANPCGNLCVCVCECVCVRAVCVRVWEREIIFLCVCIRLFFCVIVGLVCRCASTMSCVCVCVCARSGGLKLFSTARASRPRWGSLSLCRTPLPPGQ